MPAEWVDQRSVTRGEALEPGLTCWRVELRRDVAVVERITDTRLGSLCGTRPASHMRSMKSQIAVAPGRRLELPERGTKLSAVGEADREDGVVHTQRSSGRVVVEDLAEC